MKKLLPLIAALLATYILVKAHGVPKEEQVVCTPAERMYEAIILYADSFDVPLHIAFNVATIETSYRGPNDTNYVHNKVSPAGAVGPMQIMPKYASWFAGFPVERQELKDSIELNVWLSMKILNYQYKQHGTWEKALGAYNTGRPIINSYARNGVRRDFFEKRWID